MSRDPRLASTAVALAASALFVCAGTALGQAGLTPATPIGSKPAPAADATASSQPKTISGREVKLSPEVKAVLDRAAAAYHGMKTYQDRSEVETVFGYSVPSGERTRMISHKTTRFAYAGPRRFTLRGDNNAVYGYDNAFTNQIRTGRDENGKPTEEKEVIKLKPDAPIDWADCMGNIAEMMPPTPVHALLMTGPGAEMDIFLEADRVEPGTLDEREGTWVSGKGVCPYTPGGSGGGKDVVPIRAWFSAKTGMLRQISYDISRTSWALGGAQTFAARHHAQAQSDSSITVTIDDVAVDQPIDDSVFVYSPDAPRGPRLAWESIPAFGMGGMGGMTPAGGMAPAMKPAAQAPGETITAGETLQSILLDKPAPAWTTTTPDGKNISLADYKGKVVMLDFWATWCGPCMQAIPAVQRLSEEFKDQPVAIIGVNRDKPGDESKVQRTIERKQLTFHQAMDAKGDIAKTYKISAIPALIIIDKDGVVRAVHVGYGPGEEKVLAEQINALLKGEKIAQSKE